MLYLEIKLEKISIETLERVLNTRVYGEETCEAIVPESLPDILRITDADAEVYVRAKELQGDTVVLSGTAEASVLYVSEAAEGIFVMESDMAFTLSAKCPGAAGNEKITAQVRLASLEASLINPRKILFKAELAADITVYRPGVLDFATAAEGEEAFCETLTETLTVLKTVSVREKTFSMSFENELPPSLSSADELLKTRTSVIIDEAKGVGTKVIVKGSVKTEAVFTANARELLAESFETPFSQLVETDCPADGAEYGVSAFLTGTYYELEDDGSGKLLAGEIYLAAQVVSYRSESVSYIRDMYSTRYPLHCNLKKQSAVTRRELRSQAAELSGTLQLTSPAQRLGDGHVFFGRLEAAEKAGGCGIKMPVSVSACCFSAQGDMLGAAGRFELTSELQSEGMGLGSVSVRAEELRCVIRENGLDFNLRAMLEYELLSTEETESLSEASCSEDERYESGSAPSILVIRVPEGRSIWSLAKENRSSPALIYAANPELSTEENGEGRLILIPKAK